MKTIVIGASPNSARYSNKAVRLLMMYEHEVVPVGKRKGEIKGNKIIIGKPVISDIHTVTLYIGAKKQQEYYDYILSIKPQRIIFNPGTENEKFLKLAEENFIETIEKCTLVMLNSGTF